MAVAVSVTTPTRFARMTTVTVAAADAGTDPSWHESAPAEAVHVPTVLVAEATAKVVDRPETVSVTPDAPAGPWFATAIVCVSVSFAMTVVGAAVNATARSA